MTRWIQPYPLQGGKKTTFFGKISCLFGFHDGKSLCGRTDQFVGASKSTTIVICQRCQKAIKVIAIKYDNEFVGSFYSEKICQSDCDYIKELMTAEESKMVNND